MQNPLKLALVVESITAVNGVSHTYQRLIDYCQKNDITADVYTLGSTQTIEKRGSVIIYQFVPALPVSYYPDLPPFDVKIFSPNVTKTFNQKKYDIVHLATPGSLGIALQYLARKKGIPSVGVFHTQLHEYAGRWAQHRLPSFRLISKVAQKIIWRYVRWFYQRCDLILAPSTDTQSQLHKALAKPVELFRRGVDTEQFNPKWRDESLRKTRNPIALYVGRLSFEKNLELLVELFKHKKDIDLWIVGDGKERAMLEHELPSAHFFGSLSGDELSRVYASADFFIFPSVTDTFGNVIMEAHASGLPTIVTTVGGPALQVKNGHTGYVVEPTVTAFDKAMDMLTNEYKNMSIMGTAARQAIMNKTWDAAFQTLFTEYKKLL